MLFSNVQQSETAIYIYRNQHIEAIILQLIKIK